MEANVFGVFRSPWVELASRYQGRLIAVTNTGNRAGKVRRLAIAWVAFSLVVVCPHGAVAEPPRDSNLRSGVVGTYRDVSGKTSCTRVDLRISFDWSDGGSPDPRIGSGAFSVFWEGFLFVEAAGRYSFHAYVGGGSFHLWLDGRPVLHVSAETPRWVTSGPVQLSPGLVDLEVAYRCDSGGMVKLFWESDGFLLEPLGPRHLLHRVSAVDDEDRLYWRGHQLIRSLRCAACHVLPGDQPPLAAPDLDRSLAGVDRDWLTAWLQAPGQMKPGTPMPEFAITGAEASILAAFLHKRAGERGDAKEAVVGDRDSGRRLFVLRGCAACHSAEGVGRTAPFGGGCLDRVGWKRSAASLLRLLSDPREFNPHARMPRPRLTEKERRDLVAYLRSLRAGNRPSSPGEPVAQADLSLAARLIEHYRCAACHALEGFAAPPRVEFKDLAHLTVPRSCLGEPSPGSGRPGYALGAEDRRAILTYLRRTRVATNAELALVERGRGVMSERNCTNCHRRDGVGGYARGLDQGTLQKLGLAEALRRGELAAPDLTAVGDKFEAAYLQKAILGRQRPRREWLELKMPQFHGSPDRDRALLAYLRSCDSTPTPLPECRLRSALRAADETTVAEALLAARRLVSPRGFGCMACHTMAGSRPRGAEPEARGPELVGLPEIVRAHWFVRWVRDPTRISFGVEMPGIQVAVPGVLGGNLDRQILAMWRAFSRRDFVPPTDSGVVVQTVSPRSEGRAVVLRDCMRDAPSGSGWCPRSFAVGFPGGLNVLIDLDRFNVRSIWAGDLAHEKAEHKTWLWEPAGQQAWTELPTVPALVLRVADKWLVPRRKWQSVGRLLWWEHVDRRTVRLAYRLGFANGSLDVVETWSQGSDGEEELVLRRTVNVAGSLGRAQPYLVMDIPVPWQTEGKLLHIHTTLGKVDVTSGAPWGTALLQNREVPVLPLVLQGDVGAHAEVTYRFRELDARLLEAGTRLPRMVKRARAAELPWVPGYRTVRFPLPQSVLPISIGFLASGDPLVGSLRGGLYRALDKDGDGLYDEWKRFSDYLAAPFGILVEKEGVVVAHKPELVRLLDRDQDGFAERTEVIATGWGYTHDYHDWTFGPVKDREGRYVVALGSDYQQKGRPREASRYRGHALRISRDGTIEDIARGLRFPVGLARNDEGEIFFTDNQGVQNTFNELNHLVPYSRYGVPALYDPPPDQDPWPERYPAIQIPHPWTRSVNGICFVPATLSAFGLHAGHGVGCEYDTRRLIRFTVYRVGNEYRGACYPFSFDPERDRARLLSMWRRLVAGKGSEGRNVQVAASPAELVPLGPVACAVREDGRLFVGSIRESGWGGGQNVGELLMLEPTGPLPPGILAAWFDGDSIRVRFTKGVVERAARDQRAYELQSYRRVWAGAYATPDSDRRREAIRSVRVVDGGQAVELRLGEVRPGYVYELRVSPHVLGESEIWPASAYLTAPGIPPER